MHELRRLANMKRNEDRLKQLLGLDGTWKEQMKKRAGGGGGSKWRQHKSEREAICPRAHCTRNSSREKMVHDYKRLSNGY
mmetsp:Transcript_8609/g.24125  ORF Transcript_8609/g.24125 Transcript_8609/m.24125 type:complete len:80 (-) Transcript_8609:222-461(-)